MADQTSDVTEVRSTVHTSPDSNPTLLELLEEVANLSAGLSVILLPLFATALPGIILLLVLPAVLLLAVAAVPAAIGAAIVLPPYLLVRALRRAGAASPAPAGGRTRA
jgi:hypothetical protein